MEVQEEVPDAGKLLENFIYMVDVSDAIVIMPYNALDADDDHELL